jgi:site-specific DNA-cytosine methylase
MNVLSLFDGISCGQLALHRANLPISNYYASEIDKHACAVTMYNFPKTIQLGNVQVVNKLPPIDILIGGSPCQGFSIAGQRLNFEDERSKLFFEFVRILDECKPKYFLLENVNMKQQYQDIITTYLGVNPIKINSSLVSKQNRVRLYWTNIPINYIEEKNLYYDGWLYRLGHGYVTDEIKFYRKYPTLAAQSPGTKYRVINDITLANATSFEKLKKDKILTRILTPEECEELQTLPIGYTSCIKKSNRYKAIGNGWTVDIIANILKGINL